MSATIKAVYFVGEVRSAQSGDPSLTSADTRDGYDIEYDGAVYHIRNELRWGSRFIQVSAARTLSAICEMDAEEPKAKGKK